MNRRRDNERVSLLTAALEASARDLLVYFERRVGEPQDAADLLSETMLTAWRRVDDLPDGAEGRRMWLFVTARNTLANFHRSSLRRRALAAELRLQLAVRPAVGAIDDEARAVRDAVERLDPSLRELVQLVHWDGFTLAEAAELTATNPSTARGRYAHARNLLRDALTERSVSASP